MSSFKEILKHSGNYLIANIATKALAFVSIPIYTRLLSSSEYGILSIFLSTVGILGGVLTLCTDQSISRYFFDQEDSEDFRGFVGTSSVLAFGIFIVNTVILIVFAKDIGTLFGLSEPLLMYMLILFSLINALSLTFEQIYGVLKKSKLIAISSLVRAYLSFGFSIVIILLLKEDKYYGPIVGQILGGIALIFFWIKWIKPYFKFKFDKKYLVYIFSYSVPLIPYVLSGVIIEQFGKIAIGKINSASEAGFYSLALTISSIVLIVITVSHQAWNPYYFEYMNNKNYIQHDRDQSKIFRITVFLAVFIAAFGDLIGNVLAKKSFSGSFYLIPIFVTGYVFYQLAYVYMRNFAYTKKTKYLTVTVFISGISNIILNYFIIPYYGETGAAVSFVLSYIIMAAFAWVFNKYFIKHYGSPLKLFLVPLIISIPFFVTLYYVRYIDGLVYQILLKISIVIIISIILFWDMRHEIFRFIRKKNKPVV